MTGEARSTEVAGVGATGPAGPDLGGAPHRDHDPASPRSAPSTGGEHDPVPFPSRPAPEAGAEARAADRVPTGAGPAHRRGRRALVALAAGLFVASVALAALAAVLATRLEAERAGHRDVEQVAGQFAEALLTYDFNNLEAAKRRVLSLSTGKFRKEYEQAFAGGLDVLLQETKATSTGTVTDVFVGSIEDGSATAIAVANAVAEGTAGTKRTVASYIQLDLVRVGGRWRVDGVTNLNFGRDAGQVPPAATTTSVPK